MAVDPLNVWKSELANLPKVADASWALNFATWYANRVVAMSTDPTKLVPTGFLFTFAAPLFATQLATLTPTPSAAAGIMAFANAWEAALLASTVVTLPGTFIPPSSPATIFSAVITTLIDPPSIAAGKLKLLELTTATPVDDPNNSQFPVKFREATMLLSVTVTGLNSVSPPAGPQPLVAALVPVN